MVDFVVNAPPLGVPTGIRIGTEFFHYAASPGKQAEDRQQFALLSRGMNIVDIADVSFLKDPTGAAAIIKVKQALGLTRDVDPIMTGTTRRNR